MTQACACGKPVHRNGECFRCWIGAGPMISTKATPTRVISGDAAPPSSRYNNWEKGIATEKRPGGFEMPYLNAEGTRVGVKEFAQKRNTGAWDHPGKRVSSPGLA